MQIIILVINQLIIHTTRIYNNIDDIDYDRLLFLCEVDYIV